MENNDELFDRSLKELQDEMDMLKIMSQHGVISAKLWARIENLRDLIKDHPDSQ